MDRLRSPGRLPLGRASRPTRPSRRTCSRRPTRRSRRSRPATGPGCARSSATCCCRCSSTPGSAEERPAEPFDIDDVAGRHRRQAGPPPPARLRRRRRGRRREVEASWDALKAAEKGRDVGHSTASRWRCRRWRSPARSWRGRHGRESRCPCRPPRRRPPPRTSWATCCWPSWPVPGERAGRRGGPARRGTPPPRRDPRRRGPPHLSPPTCSNVGVPARERRCERVRRTLAPVRWRRGRGHLGAERLVGPRRRPVGRARRTHGRGAARARPRRRDGAGRPPRRRPPAGPVGRRRGARPAGPGRCAAGAGPARRVRADHGRVGGPGDPAQPARGARVRVGDAARAHLEPVVRQPGDRAAPAAGARVRAAAGRLRSLAGRLGAVPAALAGARTQLADLPRVHVETAIGQFEGTAQLLSGQVDAALEQEPLLAAEVGAARDAARAAVQDHLRWLRSELDGAHRDPRLGPEAYAAKLWLTLDSETSPDEVLAAAEADLARIEGEIARAAAAYLGEPDPPPDDAARVVRRALGAVAADGVVDDATVLPLCVAAMGRTTRFVRDHDLVTRARRPGRGRRDARDPPRRRSRVLRPAGPAGDRVAADVLRRLADTCRTGGRSGWRRSSASTTATCCTTSRSTRPCRATCCSSRTRAGTRRPGSAAGVLERAVRGGLGGVRRGVDGRARLLAATAPTEACWRSGCSS